MVEEENEEGEKQSKKKKNGETKNRWGLRLIEQKNPKHAKRK